MNTTTGSKIPFTGLQRQYKNLREEILDITDAVLSTGQLMNGPWTHMFEEWLADRNNTKYAVTCHSGTHALEIIAAYWKQYITAHDDPKVLIPTLTYAATANAFIRAGWDVQLLDTDANGLIQLDDLEKVAPTYEMVVLVGLYGAAVTHHASARQWQTWIQNHHIIIEDAAQHWLSNNSTRVGEAAAISFDPMKNLSNYGNGGAIVTSNTDLLKFAQSWRDNGKPDHSIHGTNSRMSEIDCASMMIKTRYLDQWQKRRAQISAYWRERFQGANLRCLTTDDNAHNHAHHKFVIDIDRRDQIKQQLLTAGIETKVHYERPLHEMSGFNHCTNPGLLSTASVLSRRVLSLPIYPELTDAEVEYISDEVLTYV